MRCKFLTWSAAVGVSEVFPIPAEGGWARRSRFLLYEGEEGASLRKSSVELSPTTSSPIRVLLAGRAKESATGWSLQRALPTPMVHV
jgi:hypothetical protein